jgi:hypothetical protein
MGFLSKFFSKQSEAALKLLEQQLQSSLNKSNAEFISIVGMQGKIKGLDIIYVLNLNGNFPLKEMKRINAKLVELYKRYNELALFEKGKEKILKIIEFRYKTQSICVFPIEGNEKFILTALSRHPNRILKDMVKFRMHLFELRTEREDLS